MPAVKLNRAFDKKDNNTNPLPNLFQTPAGLAIIEIQGTIHSPGPDSDGSSQEIGRLEFPNHTQDQDVSVEGKWMKGIHLYVGQHQRLIGEVKKLPKPVMLLRRDSTQVANFPRVDGQTEVVDELDIAAIVRYKILFSSRPEPVGM